MNSARDGFCPRTGQNHSDHPLSFAFCPSCRAQLIHSPVRKEKDKEVIVLDDTPETKKAIFVPASKGTNRSVAETARQQSIQRTSQLAIRGSLKLPIILHACLVRFEDIDEGSWLREKFVDFEVLQKIQIQAPNVPIDQPDDLVTKLLLPELVRIKHEKITNVTPYLATDIGRDGVTHLPKSMEDFRTVKELLESGYFKRNNQGATIMYLVLEQHEQMPSYDTDPLSSPVKAKSIKKEKKTAASGLRTPRLRIKQEPKGIKKEVSASSYERKRSFSQLSDTQEDAYPSHSREGTPDVLSSAPYSLRSKR